MYSLQKYKKLRESGNKMAVKSCLFPDKSASVEHFYYTSSQLDNAIILHLLQRSSKRLTLYPEILSQLCAGTF